MLPYVIDFISSQVVKSLVLMVLVHIMNSQVRLPQPQVKSAPTTPGVARTMKTGLGFLTQSAKVTREASAQFIVTRHYMNRHLRI